MRQLVRSVTLAAILCATALLPGLTSSAHAASYTPDSYAARLLALFNATRQQHGLGPVSVASGTTSVSMAWSEHLAAAQQLSHNPNLESQLESHGSSQWTVYGENVGDADSQDPDGLFDAYMASPEHRANVLTKQYRYIGNTVVFAGGRAWNTMDFVDAYGTAAPPAAPKPVVKKAVAAPSAPRPVAKRVSAPAVKHLTVAAQKPRPLPRSDRGATRLPLAAAPIAPRTVAGTAARTPAIGLPVKSPFDTERVLVLAVATMLALHAAGLWVGVAARRRR